MHRRNRYRYKWNHILSFYENKVVCGYCTSVYAKIETSEIAVFTSILDTSGNKDLNKCAIKVPINKSASKRAR